MARARPETCAHQGGFISLLLRPLRAFRLWRLYRNSDATVPSFRDPRLLVGIGARGMSIVSVTLRL